MTGNSKNPDVDATAVATIMEMAGAGSHRDKPGASGFARAAAFAAGPETARLSLFYPPAGARNAYGTARWLLITDTRIIEVTGDLPGSWELGVTDKELKTISVSVRPLPRSYTLDISAPATLWKDSHDASAWDILRGLVATLVSTDPDVGDQELWNGDPNSASVQPDATSLLAGIRWFAQRVPEPVIGAGGVRR